MNNDEQIDRDQSNQDDKDLHKGDVKTANHVKLRKCMLCSSTYVLYRSTGSAKWMAIHNRTQVTVLGK